MPRVFNKQFGRFESGNRHEYSHDFPPSEPRSAKQRLRIKMRLAHGHDYSVFLPDFLFGRRPRFYWLQPLYFTAPLLVKGEDGRISCEVRIDLLGGAQLRVEFSNADRVAALDGTSELYECMVTGPLDMARHATGVASCPDFPELELHHHTTPQSATLIRDSRHYRLSSWNVAGSAKVTNYGYLYLTPLPRIANDDDLPAIAMASAGKIHMLVDNGNRHAASDVLSLDIYRSNSDARQSSIRHDVPCTLLAPQHVYRHAVNGQAVYYEVVRPLIHRIGAAPGSIVRFRHGGLIETPDALKSPEHAIVGDATTITGLRAPYEEETTSQILKLQPTMDGSTFLDQWFSIGNSDLFTPLSPELPTLDRGA